MKTRTRSLLRYPGSKARLTEFISKIILHNNLIRPIFIEPFCGGASVAIALLESNVVDEIVINDIDPLVASFWKCVFSREDALWLADIVKKVPLNLDFWHYQKKKNPKSLRDSALKCLYLNRTSFSGILHKSAGPIGGKKQDKWKIGCRFNRDRLSKRILELLKLSNRVRSVNQKNWIEVCLSWKNTKNTFFYLDPPFYHKANRLYRYVFNDSDHQMLYKYLLKFNKPWVLSYDNAHYIRHLYDRQELNAIIIDNTYSAHPIGGNSFIGREVVYSNLPKLPIKNNLQTRGIAIKEHERNITNCEELLRTPIHLH